MEKKRLIEELRKCDLCSDSVSSRHQCYQSAAKESGRRARQCSRANPQQSQINPSSQ